MYDGVTIVAVNVLRPDGVMVYAATSNSTRYKWEGPADDADAAARAGGAAADRRQSDLGAVTGRGPLPERDRTWL